MGHKSRRSLEIDVDDLPSEVEVEYDYEPYRPATRIDPPEGGVSIISVWWGGNGIRVDIMPVLSQKLIQKWEEEIWDSIQNYEPEYEKD